MLLWIFACSTPGEPVSIPFAAAEGEHPIACGQPTPTGLAVYDLRLFVSDVTLHAADGTSAPVTLTEGPLQTKTVAMLDFEDGCSGGTPGTHTALVGEVAPGEYEAVSFTVGVPFAENHANPAKAEGPLSETTMHWTWKGGYKFVRLDYVRDDGRKRVHLGSTGCKGEIGAPEGCARENRAAVRLPLRSDAPITVDVAGLTTADGCMGGDDEAGCAPVFTALGLDLRSGAPAGAPPMFR